MPHPTPAYVHQILISDSEIDMERLPYVIDNNISSVRNAYPESQHIIWTLDKLDRFIADSFDQEVLECFRGFIPYAYKADLARLCLLLKMGGMYCDLGVSFLSPIVPPDDYGIVAFQDVRTSSPFCFAMSNAIIWCNPGRIELEIAIDQIRTNYRERYYGLNPLYPTGPVVLGSSIVKAMSRYDYRSKPNEYYIGSIRGIQAFDRFADESIFFVSPDGAVNATRVQSFRRLNGEMIATNDYAKIWRSRQVYGEKQQRWKLADGQIALGPMGIRTPLGVKSRDNADGCLTFGPYIDLAAGRYQLAAIFGEYSDLPDMKIDIVANTAAISIAERHYKRGGAYRADDFLIEFALDDDARDVEFRTFCRGKLHDEVVELVLRRLD